MQKQNYQSFYIAILKTTHDWIEALAKKNKRTVAEQTRILLDKLASKK